MNRGLNTPAVNYGPTKGLGVDGASLFTAPSIETSCLNATFTPTTLALEVRKISLKDALDFRAQNYESKDWISDRWDQEAVHFGYFNAGTLIGSIRIVSPVAGRLPINDHRPDFEIRPGDVQVGRLLVAEPNRRSRLLMEMLNSIDQLASNHGDRIIITPRTAIALKIERFEKCGYQLVERDIPTAQGFTRSLLVKER